MKFAELNGDKMLFVYDPSALLRASALRFVFSNPQSRMQIIERNETLSGNEVQSADEMLFVCGPSALLRASALRFGLREHSFKIPVIARRTQSDNLPRTQ